MNLLPAASVTLTVAGPAIAPEAVVLLDGGAEGYPRMLLAIARAQRTVHLEVYAFAPVGVGARFVEALGQAAGRGVAVRVVIDGWGSVRGGRAVAAALREAGCTVRIYNRLLAVLVGRIRGPQCLRLGQMIRRQPQTRSTAPSTFTFPALAADGACAAVTSKRSRGRGCASTWLTATSCPTGASCGRPSGSSSQRRGHELASTAVMPGGAPRGGHQPPDRPPQAAPRETLTAR
jgi:hypothetical protein